MCDTCVCVCVCSCVICLCVRVMLNSAFIQDNFNPEDIPFRSLPTMSDTVLKTMLPDKEGKVFSANLHEGIFHTNFTYFDIINKLTYPKILDTSNLLIHSKG